MTTLADTYAARYAAECSYPETHITADFQVVLASTGEQAPGTAYNELVLQRDKAEAALMESFSNELSSSMLMGISPELQKRVFDHAMTELANSISEFDSLEPTDAEWWDSLESIYASLASLVLEGFNEGIKPE